MFNSGRYWYKKNETCEGSERKKGVEFEKIKKGKRESWIRKKKKIKTKGSPLWNELGKNMKKRIINKKLGKN